VLKVLWLDVHYLQAGLATIKGDQSSLLVLQANLSLHLHNDSHKTREALRAAQNSSPNALVGYRIYLTYQELKASSQGSDKGAMSLSAYVDFQRNYR
jgi:hypothetical protein